MKSRTSRPGYASGVARRWWAVSPNSLPQSEAWRCAAVVVVSAGHSAMPCTDVGPAADPGTARGSQRRRLVCDAARCDVEERGLQRDVRRALVARDVHDARSFDESLPRG